MTRTAPQHRRPRARHRARSGSAAVGVVSIVVIAGAAAAVVVVMAAPRPHTASHSGAPPVRTSTTSGALPATPSMSQSPALLPPLPSITGPAHDGGAAGLAVGQPVRLRIPAIHVDSRLERLGREPDGTLEPPRKWQEAGWYADGARPGEQGPAVIAGHIDSTTGPAVFFRLRDLRPGDGVTVTDSAGHTFRFVVEHTSQYPKNHFPADAVYGPTSLPELRLVTCAGSFDSQARSYRDNLVVYADEVTS